MDAGGRIVGRHDDAAVIRPEKGRDIGGIVAFVLDPDGTLKADRESLHRPIVPACHERDQQRGIDATRQEGSDRDVGDKLRLEGFDELGLGNVHELVVGQVAQAGDPVECRLPVGPEGRAAALCYEHVSGGQHRDAGQNRARLADGAPGQQLAQRDWIDAALG